MTTPTPTPEGASPAEATSASPYPVDLYPGCPCSTCDSPNWINAPNGHVAMRMSLCPTCGDKRCAGATHHDRHGEPDWEGVEERECGDHRTTGTRAWCFDCSEWCYGRVPCRGCELPALREERNLLAWLHAEALDLLAFWVHPDDPCWFDHHGGCQAHGHSEPDAGETCPHARAVAVLAAARAAGVPSPEATGGEQ